jgi:hypothetical protein
MAKRSTKVSVAAGAVLLALTLMSSATAAGCNPGGNCTVDVTVGVNCAIAVSPDPLDVPQPRGAKSITWNIKTNGFEFATNGIAFKSPNNEFEDPEARGKRFKWKNKHTRAGSYEYAVNVVGSGSNPATCSKDPLINNR